MPHSLRMLVLWTFFRLEIMVSRYAFLEKQKFVKILPNLNYCTVNRNFCQFQQFCKFLSYFLQLLAEKQKHVEIFDSIRIIALQIGIFVIFSNFLANFCLIHSSSWFYDHFFTWSHGTKKSYSEKQKYFESLNNILITALNLGVLAFFGKFWTNFCLFRFN